MQLFQLLPWHTWVFIAIIIGIWFAANYKFTQTSVDYAPAILTTTGIFATFFGIALGLLEFDASNIKSSVPRLVDGMKTAFVASAVGVFLALLVKIRYVIWKIPVKYAGAENGTATVDDLLNAVNKLQYALIGADDSTLVTQIKLLRQDSNDRLDRLQKSQESFMEKMADNNSKALINALEEVMRDFNAKINEQFGDNFKQLNQAVEKILVWQEKYKQQMSDMIEQQGKIAADMQLASDRYSKLLENAEKFKNVAESLSFLIRNLEEQRESIAISLKALGELLKSAQSSLPEIENKIVTIASQLSNSVKQTSEITTKAIIDNAKTIQESTNKVNTQIENITKDISSSVKQSNEATSHLIIDTSKMLYTSLDKAEKQLADSIKTANERINANILETSNKIDKQILSLDKALETELSKSLESLGKQLAALSSKFAADYTPLTHKLRQIIEIAEGVKK